MLRHRLPLAAVAIACLLCAAPPSPASDAREIRADDGKLLAPQFARFLADVEWLISRSERKSFLALEADYQREGFVRRFWEARDPYPETTVNEFQTQWTRRLEEGLARYQTKYDDRMKIYVVHGDPSEITKSECFLFLWPLEVWRYREAETLPRGFTVLFYKPSGGGPSRRWQKSDGYSKLRGIPTDSVQERIQDNELAFFRDLRRCLGDDFILEDIFMRLRAQNDLRMNDLVDVTPKVRDTEWLQTFRADSTELAPEAARLVGKLTLGFPDRDRGRTLDQGLLEIAGAEAGEFDGAPAIDIRLVGEVLRDGALFENFRYRYAIPLDAGAATAPVALTFERALRPGTYRFILRAEDLRSGKAWRDEREVIVPRLEVVADAAEPARLEAAAIAAMALSATTRSRLEIIAASGTADSPEPGTPALGAARFEARFEGGLADPRVRSVVFFLDGKRMLERTRPPYSVDLRLDDVPRTYRIRAVALDAQGSEVASAESIVNPPRQQFAVRLEAPEKLPGQLEISAAVDLPDGEILDRVEFRLNGRLLAQVEQPPYRARLAYRSETEHDFVTATAVLPDGHSAEDVRWVVKPEIEERVDVRWLQLPVTVEDQERRPVADLAAGGFHLFEAGQPREILRFETSADAPLQILLAVDTSASMTKTMDEVRSAALEFLRAALRPRDRAAVLTFADRALLSTELTADPEALKRALASLSAERGTALWDALMQGLVYLQGARGQSAIVLLSDGKDQTSRFTSNQVIEMAQRSGIAIYTLGVHVGADPSARRGLCRLTDATGGRCFFADDGAGIQAAYRSIEHELRARYLLTFEASSGADEFRRLEVRLADPKLRARTIAGYWP